MNFQKFNEAVAKRFKAMTATGLFSTNVNSDELWELYLHSFPEGTNPIFKTRTEHDCTCCRQFIRTIGGAVTIVNDKIETLWDVTVDEAGYQAVADALAAFVRQHTITNTFLYREPSVGTPKSVSLLDNGNAVTWQHFFVNLPRENHLRGEQIGPRLGELRATYDVMLRGLQEITPEAVDTVLELVAQNSLYRGEEHTGALTAFQKLQKAFKKAKRPELFCWSRVATESAAIARIRNTAIGTLLVDLSNDEDLEVAVKSFEQKVAPTNYKRPSALVTKAMIAKAKEKIDQLGFMSALERRFATIEDITINNVLYADRTAKRDMNVFDDLAASAPVDTKKLGKVEDVPIETFLTKILPQAESVEAFFENRHAGNLVSLIAPCDPTAKGMFKWDNNFSWSYAGEMTDSIKERVKQAGGSVTGDFRASLSWHNYDDLDLHLVEPSGVEIYFRNRVSRRTGGNLDVDMNAGHATRQPVENITYSALKSMGRGTYRLYVNQWAQRESSDVGFEVELEFLGTVYSFAYPTRMPTGQNVEVATFKIGTDGKLEILQSLPHQRTVKTLWGVQTQAFHKVNVAMLSPNHWDDQRAGNKHYFFMLENCRNEGRARGFFNEFLSEELTPHRKVLEVVGAKMRTDESDRQLSGLGFSSTQRNSVLVRVTGNFTRVVNVTF